MYSSDSADHPPGLTAADPASSAAAPAGPYARLDEPYCAAQYGAVAEHVVGCAHKIWDEKGIGQIYSHYRHNAAVHRADGLTYGRDQVVADAVALLAAFPDLRLYADEVIWSGDERAGFHTSHRATWVGHNSGHSIYGPPTGRRVVFHSIANCFIAQGRVVEEWLARDELALIRQLGFDEIALAQQLAARDAATGAGSGPLTYGALERSSGQTAPAPLLPPPAAGLDIADFVRRSMDEIWNRRSLNRLDEYYSPNCVCATSTDRVLYGLAELKAHILGLLGAFPDAQLAVDHVAWQGNEQDGYRVALRWTLQGTHDGPGAYGEPGGRRIRLPGISHLLIRVGKFVREWTVFDEFALLKQLHAPAGAG